MIKVRDIAYVRFAAPDLDAMERFGADFGLSLTARVNDTLYHRGSDPSPYVHVTELGEAGFRGLALEAASAADLITASKLDGASDVEKLEAGRVDTILGGTCVEVDGRRAPIYAIFPTQANIQTPAATGLGPVGVTVIRAVSGKLVALVAIKDAISPVPLPASPIAGLSFSHA